jgi:hypothetical protein
MVLLKFNSAENNVDMIRIGYNQGTIHKKTSLLLLLVMRMAKMIDYVECIWMKGISWLLWNDKS